MGTTFNLLDEPFVPVYDSAGRQECSLRGALLAAHEIRELRDTSPLVTAALHRLLLAVLHRNFGPASVKGWQKLWEAGRFPSEPLEAYFHRWRSRFNLFDPKHPFYQDAAFVAKNRGSVNQLVRELSRGNNAALFDHTFENPPPLLPPAAAARALIAEQAFALGGGKSELGYTTSAPLIGGVVVLVRGKTLFETLLLNLVRYKDNQPIPRGEVDAPAWEQDGRPVDGSPDPAGYLDYLTWQSRSICLHPEADGSVRDVSFAQGGKFDPPRKTYDPMLTYKRDREKGDSAIRLSETRDLWRDSAALFQFDPASAFRAPECLRWIRELRTEEALPADRAFSLTAIGLCTDKAKVHFWRQEALPLPTAYLTDRNLVASLKNALDLAEEVGKAVRIASAAVASTFLAAGQAPADSQRVWALVDSLAADRLYWSRLEVPFRAFLVRLPGGVADQKGQIDAWYRETLAPTARTAFDETAGQLDRTSRALRARVEGRQRLLTALARIARANHVNQPTNSGAPA